MCVLMCLLGAGNSDNSSGLCLVSQAAKLTARVQMVVWLGCALYFSALVNRDQCLTIVFKEHTSCLSKAVHLVQFPGK